MKICYLRASPMHSIADQRRELERVGFSDWSQHGPAYIDEARQKVPAWYWRTKAINACRAGADDELWVAWPSVFADSAREALDGIRQLAESGAVLCIASTGERHHFHPDAIAGLELAYEMERDARRRITSKATAASQVVADRKRRAQAKRWAEAKAMWLQDKELTGEEVAAKTGFSRAYLHRELGPRGTPRFTRKVKGSHDV